MISSDYERVTVVLHGKDDTTRTVDLDGHYLPLGVEVSSKGHAIDVTSRNYVELQHVATTMRIEVHGTVAQPQPAAPWRFDVPEVPPHVTAFKTCDGDIYVRNTDDPDRWSRWLAGIEGQSRITVPTGGLLLSAPLVECPDPRVAS
jgi:hypothetical protein